MKLLQLQTYLVNALLRQLMRHQSLTIPTTIGDHYTVIENLSVKNPEAHLETMGSVLLGKYNIVINADKALNRLSLLGQKQKAVPLDLDA